MRSRAAIVVTLSLSPVRGCTPGSFSPRGPRDLVAIHR
jgi:hypothetical protein